MNLIDFDRPLAGSDAPRALRRLWGQVRGAACGLFCGLLLLPLLPHAANAQDTSGQNVPVINPQPDINGVDVATAQFSVTSPFFFRAPGAQHLNIRSAFNGRRFTTELEAYLEDATQTDPNVGNPNSRQIRIHMGGIDKLFVCATVGACQQVAKVDGSRLIRTADKAYSFQDRDGTVVSFFPMVVNTIAICSGDGAGCNGANYSGYAYVSSITYANGEKLTFAALPTASGNNLVSTITSNLGYTVDALYPCTSCAAAAAAYVNYQPGQVWVLYGGLANAATYVLKKGGVEVDRLSFSRSLTSYPANATSVGALAAEDHWVASDKLGRTFRVNLQAKVIKQCELVNNYGSPFTFDLTNLNPTQVISPNGVETDVSYAYLEQFTGGLHHFPVTTVSRGGRNWLYDYTPAADGGGALTATDPLGNHQTRVANGYREPWEVVWGNRDAGCVASSTGADVVQSQDELGRQRSFSYAWQGAVGAATLPQSNGYQYSYDPRGNLVQITQVPKPGSGLSAAVIYQAGFDATCANPVTCNKPNWTRDAKGAQTDYQYDPTHGGETVATLPAGSSGVRPQRRSTYEAFATGNGVVYRLSQMSECMTQASCAGAADEVQHRYAYWGATLLHVSETVQSGSGGAALTTGFAYDDAGRLVQQTSPGGMPSYSLYDAVGRKVGTIGADPDGTGPLPRLAQRTTYNNDDQVTKLEEGSVTDVTAAALAAMSVTKTTDTTYDSIGQKVRESVSSGGVVYAVTDYSYDPLGRLECTAARMNPAAYGATPTSACALGSEGTQGPDRITKNVYDAAGQLVQVRKAVGTAIEHADATYSYTANGKQEYAVDANGNRTKAEFDGIDRQVTWIFPSTVRPSAFNDSTVATALSSAGGINTADYEQYGYDANGNRTSLKKRDGSVLAYSYDALNRMTLKTVPQRAGLPATDARSVYYGYDLRGLQTYARFDSATGEGVSAAWDEFGRQTASTLAMDGVTRTLSYQYDPDGDRTRVTYPDGNFTSYAYDGLDRPLTILRSGASAVASYAYDAAGRRTGFNGGVSTTYGYDGIGRVASITHALANAGYNNGYGFSYNPASQIVQLTQSNGLFAFTGANGASRDYTVNGLNQYAAAGSTSFSYDANGDLTADGATTFLYDIENRLVGASGGRSATLRYDPLGRLYETSGPNGAVPL